MNPRQPAQGAFVVVTIHQRPGKQTVVHAYGEREGVPFRTRARARGAIAATKREAAKWGDAYSDVEFRTCKIAGAYDDQTMADRDARNG